MNKIGYVSRETLYMAIYLPECMGDNKWKGKLNKNENVSFETNYHHLSLTDCMIDEGNMAKS